MLGCRVTKGLAAAIGLIMMTAVPASAALVLDGGTTIVDDGFGYDSNVATSGNGFGAVVNILTLQEPQTGSEEGQVMWNGANDIYNDPNGQVQDLSHKTATHALGDLGIDSGDELLIVWNPSEQGGDPANSVVDAYLVFYLGAAELLAIELDGDPQDHDTVNNGLGGNGFAYLLTVVGETAFDQMITDAGASAGDIRIGMYSLVGRNGFEVDNGPDTWTVAFKPGEDGQTCHDLGVCPVPEPAPLGILGAGLVWLYAIRRRYWIQ